MMSAMKCKACVTSLFLLVGTAVCAAQLEPTKHLGSGPIPIADRALFEQSMSLFDASYDAKAHLVQHPNDGHAGIVGRYMVRESSWYALGLLVRDRAGDHPTDEQRAVDLLTTVLDEQYLDPQKKWYGTFKRTPEEPMPADKEVAFRGYDPNWRHFIGTTLEMILIEYPQRIPTPLKERMYRAIDAAVSGEMHDGRLVPSYSNIALMYGALWNFAAVHDQNPDWLTQSSAWTDEVYRLFKQQGTFNEFNAPTYYGVDLYGLALWREYGSTKHMREIARAMETGLWTDIASFYQPGLRNITGPYDRSYGMDMSSYVTPTGVWMRTILEASKAPLPEHPTLTTFQVADIWFAPQVTVLGTEIPDAARAKLRKFEGPHLIDRTIDAQRTATAWVGEDAIWGGEFTSRTKDTGNKTQFHPVDAQWRMPSGQIGWLKLTRSPNIDAVADRGGVTIATDGDVSFRIYSGQGTPVFTKAAWTLPGFDVAIETDGKDFSMVPSRDCDGCVDITYTGVRSLRLNLHPASSAK
jgi:hypothetical protein